MKVVIKRGPGDEKQTIGKCMVFDNEGKVVFTAASLERGDNNNERRKSCVPVGIYKVVLEWSPKFQRDLYELKGVPNRSECKFHAANYWYQLNGCIALGEKVADINKDGYNDVTNSRNTMNKFHEVLKGVKEFELVVV